MKCRNHQCAEHVPHMGYCTVCEQFRPICPMCGAAYGEHGRECIVADGYDDLGDGPWSTRELAEHYAHCEVGLPWQVEKGMDGKFWVLVKREDD